MVSSFSILKRIYSDEIIQFEKCQEVSISHKIENPTPKKENVV
jgi:hypothetical protein